MGPASTKSQVQKGGEETMLTEVWKFDPCIGERGRDPSQFKYCISCIIFTISLSNNLDKTLCNYKDRHKIFVHNICTLYV